MKLKSIWYSAFGFMAVTNKSLREMLSFVGIQFINGSKIASEILSLSTDIDTMQNFEFVVPNAKHLTLTEFILSLSNIFLP